jgi:hypothetical protein
MLGMSIVVFAVLKAKGVNNDCRSFGICCCVVCDYLLVFSATA